MSLHVAWSGWTHCGKIRTRNEDAFLAVVWDSQEIRYLGKTGDALLLPSGQENFLFAVSDGMGGEKGGKFASRLVVQTIAEWLPRNASPGPGKPPVDSEASLVDLYGKIHERLNYYGRSYEECQGMGATLSLVWLNSGSLTFGHVGDSRVYHLPTGENQDLRQLSHDDTQVGWLWRQGKLNEREARTHPARNRLGKVLGNNAQYATPQTGQVALQPGDRFLLCSDGVVDGLWNHTLRDALATGSGPRLFNEDATQAAEWTLAERLVRRAVEDSGRDNVTAITLELLAE